VPGVPKVAQEHLDARRAQILEGARRAFAQYGYDGATVTRLEEATGLSRGAIFHYFGSKKELFFAVAADVNRHYTELITSRGLPEALRALAGENPELIAVIIETGMRMRRDEEFVQRMEEISRDQLPRFEAWSDEQRDSGAFRTDIEWQHLARFATMVINGLALRISGGDETDIETVVRLLEDALRPQAH
jgi:AcrR family transcriptional regulator